MPDELPTKLVTGSPESFGWLRRPELDSLGGQAWERPDGQLVMFPTGRRPMLFKPPPFLLPEEKR